MRHFVVAYAVLGLINIIFFSSCKNEDKVVKEVSEIRVEKSLKNADLVRFPISADKDLDTTNLPKIEFIETSYNFDTIKAGKIINKEFSFKNIGKSPLLISDVRSTCGCTIPEWSKDPIMPNQGGIIKVKFDSKHKEGSQDKPVTIYANTSPQKTVLTIKGFVIK
ncbi:MAG: DUF1573 domain-containing protein [Saprospiraceae bacterium]|nr:DUF1573 domain-containing protein [Saprospiraceae bacterium]